MQLSCHAGLRSDDSFGASAQAMDGPPKSMVRTSDFVSIGEITLLPMRAVFWREANKSASP